MKRSDANAVVWRPLSSPIMGSDRILKMLRRALISSGCSFLLWFAACPKQQGLQSTLVYVPAPPPAAASPATPSTPAPAKPQYIVIQEPPPPLPEPEPEELPLAQAPEPATHHKAKRPVHSETQADQDETSAAETPETPETPPAVVPALEPRQSSAQENELRRQFTELEQDIRGRLEKLSGAHLSGNDQKALEDARTFYTQANHAMAAGDLPRALNLAHKAGLLLAALE